MKNVLCILLVIACLVGMTTASLAIPFASEIRASKTQMIYGNDSVSISYFLNQSADSVKIQIVEVTSGTVTASFSAPATKGAKSIFWNGSIDNASGSKVTSGNFAIKVRAFSAGKGSWQEISSNLSNNSAITTGVSVYTTLFAGYPPRGLIVDNDTASPYFGHVYVTISGCSSPIFNKGVLRYWPDLSSYSNEDDYIIYSTSSTGLWDPTPGTGNASPWAIAIAPDHELWFGAQPATPTGGNGMWLGRGLPTDLMPTSVDSLAQSNNPRAVAITGTGANRVLWWAQGAVFDNCSIGNNTNIDGGLVVNTVVSSGLYARQIRFDDAGNMYTIIRSASAGSTMIYRWNAAQVNNAANYPLSLSSAAWQISLCGDVVGTRGNGLAIAHGDLTNLSDDSIFIISMGDPTTKGIYFLGTSGTATKTGNIDTSSKTFDVPELASTSASGIDIAADYVGNLYFLNASYEVLRAYTPPGASDITIPANSSQNITIQTHVTSTPIFNDLTE